MVGLVGFKASLVGTRSLCRPVLNHAAPGRTRFFVPVGPEALISTTGMLAMNLVLVRAQLHAVSRPSSRRIFGPRSASDSVLTSFLRPPARR